MSKNAHLNLFDPAPLLARFGLSPRGLEQGMTVLAAQGAQSRRAMIPDRWIRTGQPPRSHIGQLAFDPNRGGIPTVPATGASPGTAASRSWDAWIVAASDATPTGQRVPDLPLGLPRPDQVNVVLALLNQIIDQYVIAQPALVADARSRRDAILAANAPAPAPAPPPPPPPAPPPGTMAPPPSEAPPQEEAASGPFTPTNVAIGLGLVTAAGVAAYALWPKPARRRTA